MSAAARGVEDFHRIMPCAAGAKSPNPMDKGWRIRVSRSRMDGEPATITEERVLPERVMRPDAHCILDVLGEITLSTDEVGWLRDALAELHPIMVEQNAADQAALDVRAVVDCKVRP